MGLVYIALVWCAGLFVAERTSIGGFPWLLLGAGGAAAWFITRRTPHWRLAFALFAAFCMAASRMAVQPQASQISALNGLGGATVEGVVMDPPSQRDLYVQVRIAVDVIATIGDDVPAAGYVLARLPANTAVRYGDRVRVTGRMRAPDEGDAFNYAEYLSRRGVFSLVDRISDVRVLARDQGNRLVAWALDLRDGIRTHISALLPEPHAGILSAILTGDERGISPETEEAYAASGIAHLLAVSGFNMTLVGAVFANRAKRAEYGRWLWVGLGLCTLLVYTALVAFSPSASRAAVMMAFILIGNALRRTAYVPVSLAAAIIVLTAIDPAALFDLGFQLSFAAVLGITLIGTPLSRRMEWLTKPDMPDDLARFAVSLTADALIVTVAASALTMPLIALAFGRLPLASFVANVLVVPVQPAVMALGIAAVFAAPVPALAQAAAWVALVPLAWTTGVAQVMADVPEIAIGLNGPVVAGSFGLAIAVSVANATQPGWWSWLRRRSVRLAAIGGVVTTGVLAVGVMVSQPDGKLHVWVLDVGHSHAVLLQTPNGAQFLIDGGRYPSRLLTAIGERLPFNDTALDAVILTQPDPFDIGAAAAVLRRYAIDTVYTNGQPNLSAEMEDIAALAPVVPLTAGFMLDAGDGAIIEVLHPQTAPTITDALDDAAMALLVRHGDVSFLLAGETSRTAQAAMLEAEVVPPVAVLILPKHGAALDAGILDAAQPSVVVVQSDRANLQGHPNPDVLAMLPGEVPVYRTDLHGVLHFETDGRDLFVTTEN